MRALLPVFTLTLAFCFCEESLYFGDSNLQQMLLLCTALYYGNLVIHQDVVDLEKVISTQTYVYHYFR